MTEISADRANALSWLRRPHFTASDARTPIQSVLHALPAFTFFALNIWSVGLGLVVFIGAYFGAPFWFDAALGSVLAVPCILLCWGILVRCVEVEASLDS